MSGSETTAIFDKLESHLAIDEIKDNFTYYLSRILLLTLGSIISAFAVVMFLLPSSIAPAGVTGLGVILNYIMGTPIALVILLVNIPIQILAFRVLHGWKTVVFTIYTVLLYSALLEVMQVIIGNGSLTDDAFLSAVCGGVIGGIGGGLIYRAGGTVGGTSTISQILRHKYGLPFSTASLISDTAIILLAGFVISWEAALYAFIAVFINRIASDYMLEGPRDICTALIVTDDADEVTSAIADALHHDTTTWEVKGHQRTRVHQIVLVSILRSEVHVLQHVIRDVDDNAFVTILTGQTVFGDGFKPMHSEMPLQLGEIDA